MLKLAIVIPASKTSRTVAAGQDKKYLLSVMTLCIYQTCLFLQEVSKQSRKGEREKRKKNQSTPVFKPTVPYCLAAVSTPPMHMVQFPRTLSLIQNRGEFVVENRKGGYIILSPQWVS
jgi:hypothetical protein